MKTIKEWLEELPEPYKTQALTNMENDVPYTGGGEATSLSVAIGWAFIWLETPEGGIYWKDLQEEILNSELNQKQSQGTRCDEKGTKQEDMKTIKEWLEELPEPYKTQALTNMKNHVHYKGDDEVTSLSEAIGWAFIWEKTPEGSSYWDDLHQVSLNSEFN